MPVMAHSLRLRPSACDKARFEAPAVGCSPQVATRISYRTTRAATGNSFLTPRVSPSRPAPVVAQATVVGAGPIASTAQSSQTGNWYAVVANAEFFLNDVQNESVAEQLRERVRLFKEKGDTVNFWMVPNPTWLDAQFADKGKQVRRPCIALVSTDKVWIQFMKLRLDRVLWLDLGAMPEAEVLASSAKLPDSFPPPPKWTAPYSRYTPGWWNVFVPEGAK